MKKIGTRTGATLCSSMRPRSATTSWLNKFKLLALVLMTVLSINAWGETVTLWSEDWTGEAEGNKPTTGVNGTNSTNASYAMTNGTGGDTKIMNGNLAGGVVPELMIGKKGSGGSGNGGTWSVTIANITNCPSSLTLGMKYNNSLSISSNVGTVTNSTRTKNDSKTTTISNIPSTTASITITITATTTNNVRIDDISLTYEASAPPVTYTDLSSEQKSGQFQPFISPFREIVILGFFAFFCKKVFHIRCTEGAWRMHGGCMEDARRISPFLPTSLPPLWHTFCTTPIFPHLQRFRAFLINNVLAL